MDVIAVATLVSSTLTAVAAIYITFIALQQTARPEIDIHMKGNLIFPSATECIFVFELVNIGHWYASPAAIDINVWPNFDSAFVLRECRYGSTQKRLNAHVRFGKDGVTFVRAKEIKLGYKGETEEFHIVGTTPDSPGRYQIKVTAISENGAACRRVFSIEVGASPPADQRTETGNSGTLNPNPVVVDAEDGQKLCARAPAKERQ
jgi:hypothetical protein